MASVGHWYWRTRFVKILVKYSGPQFDIKMTSYQYRKPHCGDKTILRSSYLHNGISYTGKTTSLCWIGALVSGSPHRLIISPFTDSKINPHRGSHPYITNIIANIRMDVVKFMTQASTLSFLVVVVPGTERHGVGDTKGTFVFLRFFRIISLSIKYYVYI